MEIEFRVELEPLEGTVTLEGPVTNDKTEAVATVRSILENIYPDAEFIEVDVV